MKRANTCIHFNGIQHDRCHAGVSYSDVRDKPAAWPCFAKPMLGRTCKTTCDKREFPTAEEVTQAEAETEAALRELFAGTCPDCMGTLTKHESAHAVVWTCEACGEVKMRGCKRIGAW